jgi:hypothetical protein
VSALASWLWYCTNFDCGRQSCTQVPTTSRLLGEAVSELFSWRTPKFLRMGCLRARIQSSELMCIAKRNQHRYLTLFDFSQSIRPMPRARSQVVAVIDQLATTRESIKSLDQSLTERVSDFCPILSGVACLKINQGSSNAAPLSPKSQATVEEKRIQELQAKITQLKKRVRSLLSVGHSACLFITHAIIRKKPF